MGRVRMSREQWGHWYHKGIEDITSGRKCDYKYVLKLNEVGEIIAAYMIWGQTGDTYVVEDLYDILLLFHMSGILYKFSENEDEIDYNRVFQVTMNDLSEFHKPIFCINQKAFFGSVIQDAKLCDARWKEEHEK